MSPHRRGLSLPGRDQKGSDLPGWKRFLDLAFLILAFPIVAPLMLFIAVAIKVVSPGPVFFKQERVGLHGQKFICLKFRSMKVNAPTHNHQDYLKDLIRSDKPMVKMDQLGDDRLIPGARWIRATGFDELPQLINVLFGEMSWVGPRPGTLSEFEQYTDEHKGRLRTLPGLTGLWQVSGKNDTTFEEMVQYDICYAQNKSMWLDIKIMAKTPCVLLKQCRETAGKNKQKSEEKQSPDDDKKTIRFPVSHLS